jgi:uncharacterized membrane protein
MSGNRIFSLFAWLLLGVAAMSIVMSLSAMVMMGTPEPSFLGFAAVAAAAYGRHLMTSRRAVTVS